MTITSDSSNQRLVHYILLTFAFSWLLWLPEVLATYNPLSFNQTFSNIFQVTQWIAGIGPSLVAVYLILKIDG